MNLHGLLSTRRVSATIGVAAASAMLLVPALAQGPASAATAARVAPTVQVAPVAPNLMAVHAQVSRSASPRITCDAGYEIIYNLNASGGISSNGVGYYDSYTNPANSCWKAVWPYTDPIGTKGYQYQNEGGSCLRNDNGFLETSTCTEGGTLEQYYGAVYYKGLGWYIETQNPGGTYWNLDGGGTGDDIGLTSSLTYPYWDFRS
jgi:hypothetical protein